jgi:hypothetical protein
MQGGFFNKGLGLAKEISYIKIKMEISKLKNTYIISFDVEDVSISWSKGGYPFILTPELVDDVLSGAIEDCKKELEEVMHKSIENQLFKPRKK